MTYASATMTSSAPVSIPGVSVTDYIDRLRSGHLHAAWVRYYNYRTTLSALRGLSDRTLQDLGLNRADLANVAHGVVYGK